MILSKEYSILSGMGRYRIMEAQSYDFSAEILFVIFGRLHFLRYNRCVEEDEAEEHL